MIRIVDFAERHQHYGSGKNAEARMRWVKMPVDLLDERRWRTLTPESAKLYVDLTLLASQESERGTLTTPNDEIAWRLRLEVSTLDTCLEQLQSAGLIEVLEESYTVPRTPLVKRRGEERSFSSKEEITDEHSVLETGEEEPAFAPRHPRECGLCRSELTPDRPDNSMCNKCIDPTSGLEWPDEDGDVQDDDDFPLPWDEPAVSGVSGAPKELDRALTAEPNGNGKPAADNLTKPDTSKDDPTSIWGGLR